MGEVATRVGRLHVEAKGSGPALFCWPSLFCDTRILRPMMDDLARDYCVIAVDGPGHGKSGSSGRRFSLADCADAAMQVLDQHGVDRAVWIGVAWGGHVGVTAALRHRERLRGLATLNAPMAAWRGRRRLLYWFSWLVLRTAGPGAIARPIASSMLAPAVRAADPARAEVIEDCIRSSDRQGFVIAARSAMLDRRSLLPLLREVGVPTLFVAGTEDPLYSVDEARAECAAIPHARFAAIDGTAHLSVWEAPNRVLPLLREFISSLPD